MCQNPQIQFSGWITGQIVEKGLNLVTQVDNFELNFSRDHAPSLGDHIRLIGRPLDSSQCEKSNEIALIVQDYSQISKNAVSSFSPGMPVIDFMLISVNHYLLEAEAELYRFLPVQHVHVLLGMTIGRKYSNQEEISVAMKAAGLTHVLVASGANIAILAGFTHAVMRKIFSRRKTIFISLILAGLYTLVVGNQAPILRAFWMFTIMSLATFMGRKIYWFYPLLLGGFIVLIHQPLLITSLSFWLTIAATTAVFIDSGTNGSEISSTLRSTWLVFLFTSPLLLVIVGKVSLVTLLSSLVLLWLVSPITILGLVVILLHGVVPTVLSAFFYLFLWVPLEIFIRLVNLFSYFSFLQFSLESPSLIGLIIYYGILGSWCLWSLAKKVNDR